MKFFMFGKNMLLREENDGNGNDLGGGESNDIDNSAEAIAAAAAKDEKPGEDDKGDADDGTADDDSADDDKDDSSDDDSDGDDDKDGDDDGETSEGAPENYEPFELPAEYDGVIDEATMEGFSEVAKDLNLTQEQAQKLVDYEVERQENIIDAYQHQADKWKEASKVDEEIGGADHELKQAKAVKAYDVLATDEFKSLMNPYHAIDNPTGLGLGNHPEVVRLFYRVGLKMSEDGLVVNDKGGESKLSREEVMYGNTEK